MTPINYVFYIPFAYFGMGFGLLALRKIISKNQTQVLSIALNAACLILVCFGMLNNTAPSFKTYSWINFLDVSINVEIILNNASWLKLGLVQLIGLGVQLFSTKYLEDEPRLIDYYSFLNLFIASMLGLVLSGNLLLVFLFWELVGFCSYLLIGFWYEKKAANIASTKAFMINKIGDVLLLISIGLIYKQFQTFSIVELSSLTLDLNSTSIHIIGLFLFLGTLAKSAQLPLQTWLPDAMEGPTPVSAIIHAATMVAAGIFLLTRLDFLLSDLNLSIIALVGSLTALLAGYSAIFHWDIKKILAYSTISQLGMMMTAIGIGQSDAALFHLLTHAFYKAGLFLIAGALIYYAHHEQDIRKLSSVRTNRKFLKITYFICGASLMGLPLFSGFLSKETILLSIFSWHSSLPFVQVLVGVMFTLASLFTGIYVAKAGYYLFFQKERDSSTGVNSWSFMEIVIAVLALCSMAFPFGLNMLDGSKGVFASFFEIPETEYHLVGWFIVLLSLLVAFLSFRFFQKGELKTDSFWAKIGLEHFYLDKFYVHKVTPAIIGKTTEDSVVIKSGLAFYIHLFDSRVIDGFVGLLVKINLLISQTISWLDENLIDGFVLFISRGIGRVGNRLRRLQSGKMQEYLIATILILIFTAIIAQII